MVKSLATEVRDAIMITRFGWRSGSGSIGSFRPALLGQDEFEALG